MDFDQGYRKDLKYPDRLKSGYFRGYGHPSEPNLPATRDWHAIKSILIHTTNNEAGNTAYQQEARYLRDSAAVSINYVVSSHDQTLVEVLPPAFVAWHAGDCKDNDYENVSSIGIEIAWTPKAGKLPQLAIDNLTRLVRQLLEWYPWIVKVDMHRAQAVFPNGTLGRKIDPSGWTDKDFYTWRSGIFGSAAPTLITEDAEIISPARATVDQCVRYILSRPHTNYSDDDIARTIVPRYFEVCAPVGVDPLVCIAQMIHETGNLTSWWSARPRRNPAGIGVTGESADARSISPKGLDWILDGHTWRRGVSFASWERDAIPAHVGRLLTYAVNPIHGTDAQRDLSVTALEYRSLPVKLWGKAPTLKGLEGTWAVPGDQYADRIAAIMNHIRGL